jgi:hypothetical protein
MEVHERFLIFGKMMIPGGFIIGKNRRKRQCLFAENHSGCPEAIFGRIRCNSLPMRLSEVFPKSPTTPPAPRLSVPKI